MEPSPQPSPELMRKNAGFVFWALLGGLGIFAGLCFVAKFLPPVALPVFYLMDGLALFQVLKGLAGAFPASAAARDAVENRWNSILLWPFVFPALFRKLDAEPRS